MSHIRPCCLLIIDKITITGRLLFNFLQMFYLLSFIGLRGGASAFLAPPPGCVYEGDHILTFFPAELL